jgi:protein XagA
VGGVWLLPPGDGQVIVDTFFSDSTYAFDAQGHLIPVPSYKKFELGTYIEYGLTNFASPSYHRIQNPPPGQSHNGLYI